MKMRILHTADIHLQEYDDEKWQALDQLIKIGRKEKVDVFLISGDLFDKDINAESLRPKIRDLFSNNGFKVLIIPGNHDTASFGHDLYFGEDTVILNGTPYEHEKVRFFGIPFQPMEGEKLISMIRSLGKAMTCDMPNIVVYHGELLDSFFSRMDFGEEGEGRYMPAKLSYFGGLNIDYVLAGHFHTNFDVRMIEANRYFVYPGSPVSVTKREVGRRQVNLFTVGEPPRAYALDTPHFEEKVIILDPFSEDNPLDAIKKHLEKVHLKAKLILRVEGYIDGQKSHTTEAELAADIKELLKGKKAEDYLEYKDIQKIADNDIFKTYAKKLEQSGCTDEECALLRDIATKAIMKAAI